MPKPTKKKSNVPENPKPKRTRARTPNNQTTTNFHVSDGLWEILQPLLPVHPNTHRFGGGRPRVPDRQCADGIFYVLRTGCQWKALDATDLGSGSTAHSRFQAWTEAGIFLKFWQQGVERFDELKGLDWNWLSMDGAMTKAPLAGEKKRSESHGSRQKRSQT
jgi:putative transposase